MSVSIYLAGQSSIDDFNVSNSNFVSLMALVGVDVDPNGDDGLCGEFAGLALEDLRDNVRLALEGIRAMPALDGGSDARVNTEPGRCRAIDCGRREGYYADRLSALLALIELALEEGSALHFS